MSEAAHGTTSSWLPSWIWSSASGTQGQQHLAEEDFSDLDALEFLHVADNCTIHGQPVIVIQGKQLVLYPGMDYERLFRYVHSRLTGVASEKYVILYVHTEATYWQNSPGVMWLRRLHERLPSYVRENLSSFYILHCNWALWSVLLTICPYTMSNGFWGKVEYLSRIEYLEDILKGTLPLPQYVLDHDGLLEEQPLADYGVYASKEQMAIGGEAGNPQASYH